MIDYVIGATPGKAANLRYRRDPWHFFGSVGCVIAKIYPVGNIEKRLLDFHLTGGHVNNVKEGYSLLKRNNFRLNIVIRGSQLKDDGPTAKACRSDLFYGLIVTRLIPSIILVRIYKSGSQA